MDQVRGLVLNRSKKVGLGGLVEYAVKASQIVKMDEWGEMPRKSEMIEHVDDSGKKSEKVEVRVEGVRGNDKDLCLEKQGEGVVGQSLSYNTIIGGG